MMRLVLLALGLATVAVVSLMVGVRAIAPADYIAALTTYDPTNPAHVALMTVRVPRLIAGLIAGGALGVAGSVMQAVTRNPLADPGLMGVNAGAAFAILAGTLVLGGVDAATMAWLTFPGAALAAGAVFALGGGLRGDAGPVRLTLAGAALNAFLLSLVTGIVLVRQDTLDALRFWVAGSLSMATQRPLDTMGLMAGAGVVLALMMAPRIEALSLGDALARGLGTRPGRVQGMALVAITLCTGAAVAVAGPIAFLGLMVPPLARILVGHDMRRALVASGLIGATVLIAADTLGRIVLAPSEVRVGVMTALIGGPVFIWVARRLRPGAQA